MSDAVLGLIETLSAEYRRDVTLTRVHSHGAWRAECAGLITQSQVSPEEALIQLADRMKVTGLCKRETDMLPAVQG